METKARASQLARSVDDRRIAGVAGGLGPYLGVDPTWVRLAFAIASLFWGFGLIVYAVLWVMLPESGGGEDGSGLEPSLAQRNPQGTLGVMLLALGMLLLLWKFLSWISFKLIFPILLVGLGIFLLRRRAE